MQFQVLIVIVCVNGILCYTQSLRKVRPATLFERTRSNIAPREGLTLGVPERIQRASLLAIFPTKIFNLQKLQSLKKELTGWPYSATYAQDQLTTLIDKTPFCVAAGHLTSKNFCIFIDPANEQENYEGICSWVRRFTEDKTSRGEGSEADTDNEVLLCKRGHMIRINV